MAPHRTFAQPSTNQGLVSPIGVLLTAGIAALLVVASGVGGWYGAKEPETAAREPASEPVVVREDIVVGDGPRAEEGNRVTILYTAYIENVAYNLLGEVFEDRTELDRAVSFVLGAGRIAPVGLEEGVRGMRVGGERFITVPPELGFGDQQVGPVPPDSTLMYEIALIEVR